MGSKASTIQNIIDLKKVISENRPNYENNVVKIFNDFMDSTYSLQDFKKLNPFLKINKKKHTLCIIFILSTYIFTGLEASSLNSIKTNLGLSNASPDKEKTFFNNCALKSHVFKKYKNEIGEIYNAVTPKSDTKDSKQNPLNVNQEESKNEDDILKLSYDDEAKKIILTTYINIVSKLKKIIKNGIENKVRTEANKESGKQLRQKLKKEFKSELNNLVDDFNSFKGKIENTTSVKKIDALIENLKKSFDADIKSIRNKCKECKFDKETLSKINLQYLTTDALETNEITWKETKGTVVLGNKKTTITATPIGNYFEYEDGKRGISSRSANTSKHAANVWINKVEAGEGDKNKKPLFSAVRFANTRGKKTATKELLLAMALQSCNFNTKTLFDTSQNKPYKFSVSNIQLLSPTSNFLKKFGFDGDIPFKQMDRIKKLCNGDQIKLVLEDSNGIKRPIYLKPDKDPVLFNFGSNDVHYSKFLSLLTNKSKTYKRNLESMQTLFGKNFEKDENFPKDSKVGMYLAKAEEKVTKAKEAIRKAKETKNYEVAKAAKKAKAVAKAAAKNKKIVETLSRQIINMWKETKGNGYNDDRFGIQSRLSVLLYYLGYQVSFNCKSGKDRTGIMAVESNFIVQKINSTGKVPDYKKELDSGDKKLLRELYKASGIDQITSSCTGFRGTKTSEVNRIGDTTGASKHANS
ncbi:MAG: inositol phosphate phosphatase SopB [Clostridia bacterium]|nr:inositol phosphate phosphatase SopB [Clostridia bacterium]